MREAPADHREGAADALGPRRVGKRRERRGYLPDVGEIRPHPADAVEVSRVAGGRDQEGRARRLRPSAKNLDSYEKRMTACGAFSRLP